VFARPYTDRARAASCCLAIDRFETYLRVTRSLPARRVRNYFHYPLLAILPEFPRNEGIESVQDLGRDAVTRLVLSLEERQEGRSAHISRDPGGLPEGHQAVLKLGGGGGHLGDGWGADRRAHAQKKRKNVLTADEPAGVVPLPTGRVERRDRLGGLLHEYFRAA